MKKRMDKVFVCNLLWVLLVALLLPVSSVAQNETDKAKALSQNQRNIIEIAVWTAAGELQLMKPALNKGLDDGLTINQIKEAIVHTYAYCGFPRSIRGLQTLIEVIEERKAKGIIDQMGKEASTINDTRTKYDRGKEVLQKLTGNPQDLPRTGYSAFSPEIEVFLKEHLFADLFERDVLTFLERELVTISVISAIGKAEPMLKSHFNICLNLGLTPAQLDEFVTVIKLTLGKKPAKAAGKVLEGILSAK